MAKRSRPKPRTSPDAVIVLPEQSDDDIEPMQDDPVEDQPVEPAVEPVPEPPKPSTRVRMLRDGVTSEHGPQSKGDVIETELATLFVERGWAEPA